MKKIVLKTINMLIEEDKSLLVQVLVKALWEIELPATDKRDHDEGIF